MEREIAWKSYTKKTLGEVMSLAERYKDYLSVGKTERECVCEAVKLAEKNGYCCIYKAIEEGRPLNAGDRFYLNYMGKCIVLFIIGKQPFEKGMNIIGAHIDSPRLDIKQNPVYESDGLVYMDTHYYGGIKSFQWVALPLALHGVVVKKDGSTVTVNVGENDSDPVFCISDILPHLGQDQAKRSA
ncbi:MAG: aminopeptidase, partial [Clostridia bacterium]|nr:aminopeptidase [Clostridia bacterium]